MPKSVDDIIHGALMHAYDPAKAHEYYMRTRKLKGRESGAKVIPIRAKKASAPPKAQTLPPSVKAEVERLKSRLNDLNARLREILQNEQDGANKDDKKSSSEKSEDARDSKKYREKHKAEIAQKRKQDTKKSGGGSSGGSSISSMSETEVRTAISRTRSNLKAAVVKARAAANRRTA